MNKYFLILLFLTIFNRNANAASTVLNATVAIGSAASFFPWIQPTYDFIKTHGFQLIAMEGLTTFIVCPLPRLTLDALTAGSMGYALYKDIKYGLDHKAPPFLKGAMAISTVGCGLFFLIGLATEKTIFSRHPKDFTEMQILSRLLLDVLTVIATTIYFFKH